MNATQKFTLSIVIVAAATIVSLALVFTRPKQVAEQTNTSQNNALTEPLGQEVIETVAPTAAEVPQLTISMPEKRNGTFTATLICSGGKDEECEVRLIYQDKKQQILDKKALLATGDGAYEASWTVMVHPEDMILAHAVVYKDGIKKAESSQQTISNR